MHLGIQKPVKGNNMPLWRMIKIRSLRLTECYIVCLLCFMFHFIFSAVSSLRSAFVRHRTAHMYGGQNWSKHFDVYTGRYDYLNSNKMFLWSSFGSQHNFTSVLFVVLLLLSTKRWYQRRLFPTLIDIHIICILTGKHGISVTCVTGSISLNYSNIQSDLYCQGFKITSKPQQ